MTAERVIKLAVIGTAGGIFSGLFGIGGGTVVVPLLIVLLAYGEHEATGTSLFAISIIAAIAAIIQAAYGNVHFWDGVLIGLPAIAGVFAGTWLQQKLSGKALSLVFSAFLVVVGLNLLLK